MCTPYVYVLFLFFCLNYSNTFYILQLQLIHLLLYLHNITYIYKYAQYFRDQTFNIIDGIDFDVLVLLASIMCINHLVVNQRETTKVS